MHSSPVWDNSQSRAGELIVPASHVGDTRRAVLMLSAYEGWYLTLSRLGATLPAREDGRSWRVNVVVRPLGWLGSYRLSRRTGAGLWADTDRTNLVSTNHFATEPIEHVRSSRPPSRSRRRDLVPTVVGQTARHGPPPRAPGFWPPGTLRPKRSR